MNNLWFVFIFTSVVLFSQFGAAVSASELHVGSVNVRFRDDPDPHFDLHNKGSSSDSSNKGDSSDSSDNKKNDRNSVDGDKSDSVTPKHGNNNFKTGITEGIRKLKLDLLRSANKPKIHNDRLYIDKGKDALKKCANRGNDRFHLVNNIKSSSGLKWVISWSQTLPRPRVLLTMVPDVTPDGLVIAASSNGRVRAFSISSGIQKWGMDLPDLSAGVLVDDSRCFVVSTDGTVYAISARDGAVIWSYQLGGDTVTALPVVDGNTLFVRTVYGSVVALNKETGSLLWRFYGTWSHDLVVRDPSPLTIYGPYVFVAAPRGQLFILDKITGHLQSSLVLYPSYGIDDVERMTDLVGSVFPAKSAGVICAVSFRHSIGCYQVDRKSFVWSRDVHSFYGAVSRDQELFISSDGGVVRSFYVGSGNQVWTSEFLGDTLLTRPTLFRDYLLVGDRSGRVSILDVNSGVLVHRLQFYRGASFVSAPRVWGDYVVLLSQDGHLFCVRYLWS